MTFLFIYLTRIFQLFAAIFATRYIVKNKKNENIKFFSYYLWSVVVVETYALIPIIIIIIIIYNTPKLNKFKDSFFANSIWIYNIFIVLTGIFLTYFIKTNLKGTNRIKINIVMKYFLGIISLINFLWIEDLFKKFSSQLYLITALCIIINIMFYGYENIKYNKENIKTPISYIMIGTFFFYTITPPLFILLENFDIARDKMFFTAYRIIITLVNCIMYGSFILGFIVCLQKNKSY